MLDDYGKVNKVGLGSPVTPIKFDFSDAQDTLKKIQVFGTQTYYNIGLDALQGALSGKVNQSESAATNG